MLARAEIVDSEIHAGAGEQSPGKTPDLDGVSEAAAGTHAEIGEDWMRRIQVGDSERLRLSPEPASIDFIVVSRPPIMQTGNVYFQMSRVGLTSHAIVRHLPE